MRKIKYRAWIKEESKMGKVVAMDWNDTQIITCHIETNEGVGKYYPEYTGYGDDIQFMEYTGLMDKYRKYIYEGDIVGVFDLYAETGCEISRFVGCIEFANGSFYVRKDEEYSTYRLMDLQMTVIGNKYENPERWNN